MSEQLGALRVIDAWEAVEGTPSPLGATWVASRNAFNFALYTRYATAVTLLFYTESDPVHPAFIYHFNPQFNKTGRIWHCWIPESDINGATLYAYRIEGPFDPSLGHRFDAEKVLLDPYAEDVFFPPDFSREAACKPGPNDGKAPLGVLPRHNHDFDWGEDLRPRHTHDTIVYELHVRGFTARANSGVSPDHRGTFSGLIEKLPYLKELGVTVVELLPVHQFDPQEGNYWGYMTLNFFAPHKAYAGDDPNNEFRAMVKAFHEANIEVWLDVVYNHTCEGDENGPNYSFRGIDNRTYYLLTNDRRFYRNDTGCGNTFRTGHIAPRSLVLRSLRHWIDEMHVDGFRFDLASIFARTSEGDIDLVSPPIISEISLLAYQHDVRLVAEAWDISSYLLGRAFPGLAWRQWNGKFRDDVRAVVKGDPGKIPSLMTRLYGSDDLFPDSLQETYRPYQSVNFITAHDGFCLYDLVAYNQKHNEANGHFNTDGTNDNISWNCGWEGDAGAPTEVLALRRRQVKNFITLLMLANGTPMFCAGDEFLNTQRGNNNPYNQDNEITWLDWDLLAQNQDMFRFFKQIIAFRKAHRSIGRSTYWRDDIRWYGVGKHVDLSRNSHTLAYCLHGHSCHDEDIYVMCNFYWQTLTFVIQEGEASQWRRVLDTSLPSPNDICEPGSEAQLSDLAYKVGPRSIVVCVRHSQE
jgi:glycogen operon protein